MNSIRQEVTGQTLANQVRLESAAHAGSFLLVEGSTDSRLFARFVEDGACSVIVCLGRENLFEAITILEDSSFLRVLAYADRDYFNLIGYPEYRGVVIFTDNNDLETQIIESAALSNIVSEFGSAEKVEADLFKSGSAIHEIMFSWCSSVGALRLASSDMHWSLKFEEMDYKFVDRYSPELAVYESTRYVVMRTPDCPPPTVADASAEQIRLMAKYSARELCNGHDCLSVLGRALQRRWGSTNQFKGANGQIALGKILRLAYEYEFFRQTRGYREIRRWEGATGYRVLRA